MTAPPFHRKIGGIHWFALGRVRIGVCWVKYPGISRKMARAFSLADQRPKAVPKRGSALPAGEARTRARGGTDMPAGDYTAMPVAEWRAANATCSKDAKGRLVYRPSLPRTAVFPWPPETKQ